GASGGHLRGPLDLDADAAVAFVDEQRAHVDHVAVVCDPAGRHENVQGGLDEVVDIGVRVALADEQAHGDLAGDVPAGLPAKIPLGAGDPLAIGRALGAALPGVQEGVIERGRDGAQLERAAVLGLAVERSRDDAVRGNIGRRLGAGQALDGEPAVLGGGHGALAHYAALPTRVCAESTGPSANAFVRACSA